MFNVRTKFPCCLSLSPPFFNHRPRIFQIYAAREPSIIELSLPGHVSRNYLGKSGTDSNYVSACPSLVSISIIRLHFRIFVQFNIRSFIFFWPVDVWKTSKRFLFRMLQSINSLAVFFLPGKR